MKIIYFFDILEGNIRENYYFTLKKKEINKHITQINRAYKSTKISLYCLNKEKGFLISENFPKGINSIFDEYKNIKRDIYTELVHKVWVNVRNFIRNIIKSSLDNLNYLMDIMEYSISKPLLQLYEIFEYIKLKIIKEKPDLIYFTGESDIFTLNLKGDLKLNNVKLVFLKSQCDFFYNRFNRVLITIWNFFGDFNKCFRFKLKYKKRRRAPLKSEGIFVGISAPTYLLYTMEMSSIKEQLKKEKVKFRAFKGIYDMVGNPSSAKMKFKYVSLLHLRFIRKYLNNSRIKNLLLKDLKTPMKDYAYFLTKKAFLEEIIKALYTMKNFEKGIELSQFKVILINNEFGPSGKSINYVCKNYGIPVYFVPYCGIVRRDSDVTPRLSNFISVDGELDKEYLTKKGVDEQKILVRGSPKYELLLNKSFQPLREIADHFTSKKHLIIKEKFKILLTTTTFKEEFNAIILRSILSVLKKMENIQLIIKLHTKQYGKLKIKILREMKCNAVIVKEVDILEIIKTADILLTEESSVILDSMVVGTPIICIDFINKGVAYSAKHVYNNEKFIIIVHDEQNLFQKLNELINSPSKVKEYKNSLKNSLKKILYHKENYSPAQQIVADIKKIINYNNKKNLH